MAEETQGNLKRRTQPAIARSTALNSRGAVLSTVESMHYRSGVVIAPIWPEVSGPGQQATDSRDSLRTDLNSNLELKKSRTPTDSRPPGLRTISNGFANRSCR